MKIIKAIRTKTPATNIVLAIGGLNGLVSTEVQKSTSVLRFSPSRETLAASLITQHMNSKIVGQLSPTDYDPDFFYSQPFPIPYFDNKEIKVGFVEAEHQLYLEGADKMLENFIRLSSIDRIGKSDIVHQYYSETLKYGYTKPLDIKTAKDIWNFITPTEIIIYWDEDGEFYLCVSCECEWEEEHGLQLVFKNGLSLTRASGHDGHFSD